MICEYCNKEVNAFWKHIQFCKKKPPNLKSPTAIRRMKKGRHIWTEEEKKMLSEKRKRFLRENPDKHPWKNKNKKISIPCENVKKYLDKNKIEYVEEMLVVEGRMFSVDIAFPHIKVGLEINGNQHYKADGTLAEYYQKRHDIIEATGWTLHEIHFSQCFHEESIRKIINFDIPIDNKDIIIESKNKSQRRKEKIAESKIPKVLGEKRKKDYDAYYEECKNEIFKHNIDFSNSGWVQQVADVMGRKSGNVKKWMIRYHSEFYEAKCYKKKCVKISKENLEKRRNSREKRYNEHWKELKNKVFENNIDFTKLGWVKNVENVIGCFKGSGAKWMKKNHPEFYEKECFKINK